MTSDVISHHSGPISLLSLMYQPVMHTHGVSHQSPLHFFPPYFWISVLNIFFIYSLYTDNFVRNFVGKSPSVYSLCSTRLPPCVAITRLTTDPSPYQPNNFTSPPSVPHQPVISHHPHQSAIELKDHFAWNLPIDQDTESPARNADGEEKAKKKRPVGRPRKCKAPVLQDPAMLSWLCIRVSWWLRRCVQSHY